MSDYTRIRTLDLTHMRRGYLLQLDRLYWELQFQPPAKHEGIQAAQAYYQKIVDDIMDELNERAFN